MRVSGIILAGGASRRMGRDKAWIELDGKFLIERVIEPLTRVCDEIIVVANDADRFQKLGARIVRDEFQNTGSLGGLYAGLNVAQNEWAIAVACDMPFLNGALLQFLISLSFDCDIVIPSVRDERKSVRDERNAARKDDTAKKLNLHPLHALYHKTCLLPMRDAILKNDLRMISFHADVRVRVVEQIEIEKFDPQHVSFWNVNTPEELNAREQLSRKAIRKEEIMIAGLGVTELMIILVIVVVIFGASRLTDIMGAMGKGIAEFRKGTQAVEEPKKEETPKNG